MAVYTHLSDDVIRFFLTRFSLSPLEEWHGIAEGVENSNFLLRTRTANYILTLFEQRVNAKDIPYYLELMNWLNKRGICCPSPVAAKDGQTLLTLKDKPATIVTFLEGEGVRHITEAHMRQLGDLVARMHLAAEGFPMTRRNAMGIEGWQDLFARFRTQADSITPHLEHEMAEELDYLASHWPSGLPTGPIHADLFPDNVFFKAGATGPELTGVIDFYFACNDFWAYDLIVCLNAWCFDGSHRFVPERAKALLQSYHARRPLTEGERQALPTLARGAAMRFLVTRAHDWLNRVPGALVNPKDPMEYAAKLHFHQTGDRLKELLGQL